MDKYVIDHPKLINIETTQRCNITCKMCSRVNVDPASFKDTDMSMEVFEKILPLMKDVETIWLSGSGEPLMNKNLIEMIKAAKQSSTKAEVSFTTNALLLTARKCEELIDAGLDKFQVSIDGTTSWGHVGGGASLEKVVNNLKRLNEIKARRNTDKPVIMFNFTVMKDNIHEFPDILDMAHELGVKFMTVQPLIPFTEEMRDQNIYRHRRYALKIIKKSLEKADRLGIELMSRLMDFELSTKRRDCDFPNRFFHVSFLGTVFMCCGGMPTGHSVLDVPAVEIWNSEPYLDLRRRMDTHDYPPMCKQCPLMWNTIKNQEKNIPDTGKKFIQRLRGKSGRDLANSAKRGIKRLIGK